MIKLYKLLILLSFLFISYGVKGQQRILQVDSFKFDRDTIVYGDSVGFSYRLTNISDSNLSYNGAITTYLKTDLESNPKPIQSDTVSVNIPNKQFRIITGSFHVANPYFDKSQRTIVVVWPTGTGNVRFEYQSDSIRADLYVENNVSVKEPEYALNLVRFYPNPAKDILHFSSVQSNITVKRIQLTNLQGKNMGVHFNDLNQQSIDMRPYKNGVYLLQVELSSGDRATYRIIKNE